MPNLPNFFQPIANAAGSAVGKIGDLLSSHYTVTNPVNQPNVPAQQPHVSAPLQPPQQPQSYSVRGMQLTPQDLQTLRNVLYAEISNRSPDKQQMEARTITNTALNRIQQYRQQGQQMSLHDVLTAPNQYQGYGSPQYKRITTNATTSIDAPKLGAIDSVLHQVKSGNLSDNTGGLVYYHHDPTGKIWLKPGTLFKQPAQRSIAELTTP